MIYSTFTLPFCGVGLQGMEWWPNEASFEFFYQQWQTWARLVQRS